MTDPEPVKPELNIWPGEEFGDGSVLKGTVVDYDATGGQGEQGFVDVLSEETDIQHRFFLNGPGRSALDFALKTAGMKAEGLVGAVIVVRYDGWKTSKRGREYRDFAVGVAPADISAAEPEGSE